MKRFAFGLLEVATTGDPIFVLELTRRPMTA